MRKPVRGLAYLGLALLVAGPSGGRCGGPQAPPTIESTIAALRTQDYRGAAAMTQVLIRENPRDPRVWTLQGAAFAGLGEEKESLSSYEQALKLRPDYLPALEGAAQCEYRVASPRAKDRLDSVLRIDPKNETAHAMLAALSFRQKQFAEAATHFALAPHAIAANPVALTEYGICLVQAQQFETATPVFQRLFQLDATDWHNRYNLGLIQYKTGDLAAAIDTLKPLVEDPAPKVDALNLIAAAYEATHDTPAATAALRRAIEIAPRDLQNYLDLASLCMDHAAFQVGIDVLTAGMESIPDSPELYAERAVLQAQLKQYDEAEADFEKADQLRPQQTFTTMGLGIELLEKNDTQRSVEVIRARLRKSPDEPELNFLLAEALARRGAAPGSAEFKEAEAAAQRAVKSNPHFAPPHDVLSRLYLRAGDTTHSIEECRLALKVDPTDRTALYHLINALRAGGDKAEVEALTEKLRKLAAAETRNQAESNRYRIVETDPIASGPIQ